MRSDITIDDRQRGPARKPEVGNVLVTVKGGSANFSRFLDFPVGNPSVWPQEHSGAA